MKVYEPPPGEYIDETADKMVTLANETKDTVIAEFNEINLTANPNSSADAIVAYYREERVRRYKAYQNSPEGKKTER